VNKSGMVLALLTMVMLGGCASKQAAQEQAGATNTRSYDDPKDPFESVNRSIYDFNFDVLDAYILRPVAVVYADYMPGFARTGLHNMALNLEEPSNTLNNLLQGKVSDSFVSLGRFLVNSTVGLLGAIDVAQEIGMGRKEEEFGEVLGKWGVGTGPYLMIPAMGPNDIRSGVGDVVDTAYFPLEGLNIYFSILRTGIKVLETRANLIQQEGQLNSSADPYTFVKSAYFQNLEYRVNDGVVEQTKEEEALDEDIDAYLDGL
jgi:phospholipid-binding lipoprotein MlaA